MATGCSAGAAGDPARTKVLAATLARAGHLSRDLGG